VLLAMVAAAAPAAAATNGLPSVDSGHRPGPDALYAKPADAPQLDNAAPWKAKPILVSGAQAYRDGEWLYQDFLFDDHGALGVPDPNTPWDEGSFTFSPPGGTFTYPSDPAYANNAADLVELRIRPLADATAFRVTLNSLTDPSKVAFTIALGSSDAARSWPAGAGVSSPAALFVTVHGTTASLSDGKTGASASVDVARRQFDVRVPHSAWDPGSTTQRVEIGTGLWDAASNAYLKPSPGPHSASAPGGGSPAGAAIVNVGPRFSEPWPDVRMANGGLTIGDAAAGAAVEAAWWRERQQSEQLALGDVSPFYANVDFGKLAARVDDDSGVPKTGPLDRIMASRYVFGQGLDPTQVCFTLTTDSGTGAKCRGRFVGQLQPYALYVPKSEPAGGYGLTLLLHSLSANYNQYSASRNQSQLGDRAPGSLVITPNGRGPDGFYAGVPEADTFEVWADVARHYRIDPSLVDVSGYSMGGFGTYRLLARWPDLFARGFSVVGAPGSVDDQLASLRNTPLLMWNATADELVNIQTSEQARTDVEAAGLRYAENLYTAADHLTLATNDWFLPGAEFLGDHRVDLAPAHVTYVVDGSEDSAEAQAVGDHAYWLSGITARNAGAAGTIDARSEAFGEGDPKPVVQSPSAGTLDGGTHGPMPFVRREQTWTAAPATPVADRLVVHAANVSTAVVDARRARLSCAPQLEITGDVALTIDCGPAKPAACAATVRVPLPRVRGQRTTAVSGRHVRRARGHNLRRATIRRPSRRAFIVRIRMRTSKGRTVVVKRRVAACGG
jgi:poly(3-hydroxybutyrate) depolymerase